VHNDLCGWIKLHRKLMEKAYYRKDSEKVHLWIHLLMKASFSENKEEYLGGKLYKCAPGEFTTGRRQLSLETGISESKIERCLTYFEKIEQQIEQQKMTTNRLIRILKWNLYQQSEQQNEQRVNNDRTASEQRVNTLKERKKERRKEGKKKDIYAQNFDEFYALYPKKKAKKKAQESWDRLKFDDGLFERIMRSLEEDINSKEWNREGGQFIPFPATWLNQRRWEDCHNKIETVQNKKTKEIEEELREKYAN
jgi:hypothetical protein